MFVTHPPDMCFRTLVDTLWQQCQPQLEAGHSPSLWLALFAVDQGSITRAVSSLPLAGAASVVTNGQPLAGASSVVANGLPLAGAASVVTNGLPLAGAASVVTNGLPLAGAASVVTNGLPLAGAASVVTNGLPLAGASSLVTKGAPGDEGASSTEADGPWQALCAQCKQLGLEPPELRPDGQVWAVAADGSISCQVGP